MVLWIQPSQADIGPTVCIVPLSSVPSVGSDLPPGRTNTNGPMFRQSCVTSEGSGTAQDPRQDVLALQTEELMLRNQNEEVDEHIREARRRMKSSNSAKKASPLSESKYVPEQNQILRREVAAKEQEISRLRKEWWAMRSGLDSCKNSLPVPCQATVRALLRDGPSTLTSKPPSVGVDTHACIMMPPPTPRMSSSTLQVPRKPRDQQRQERQQSLAGQKVSFVVEGQSPSHKGQFRDAASPQHPSEFPPRQRNLDIGFVQTSQANICL